MIASSPDDSIFTRSPPAEDFSRMVAASPSYLPSSSSIFVPLLGSKCSIQAHSPCRSATSSLSARRIGRAERFGVSSPIAIAASSARSSFFSRARSFRMRANSFADSAVRASARRRRSAAVRLTRSKCSRALCAAILTPPSVERWHAARAAAASSWLAIATQPRCSGPRPAVAAPTRPAVAARSARSARSTASSSSDSSSPTLTKCTSTTSPWAPKWARSASSLVAAATP